MRKSVRITTGFAVLALLLAGIGWSAYSHHAGLLARRQAGALETLAELEARRLASWWAERSADLDHYSRSFPGFAHPRTKAWWAVLRERHPEYESYAVPKPHDLRLEPYYREGNVYVDLASENGRLVLRTRADAALPSLARHPSEDDGRIDLLLARAQAAGARVFDHDPANPGLTKEYLAGPDSALSRALRMPGRSVEGLDHLGRTVVAQARPFGREPWRIVVTREVGLLRSASRLLALTSAGLGALGVAGALGYVLLLQRESEKETRLARERADRLAGLYRTLAACTSAIARADSRDGLLDEVCRTLHKEGGFALAVAWWGADDRLLPVAARGKTEVVGGVTLPAREKEGGSSATTLAYASGSAVVVDDIAADTRTETLRAASGNAGLVSLLSQPLKREGRVTGVLTVVSERPAAFGSQEQRLLAALAADIGYALDNLVVSERAAESDRALTESRRLLLLVTNALPGGIFIFDRAQDRVVYSTPHTAELLGGAPSALGPLSERVHPDDRATFQRNDSLADGEVCDHTFRIRRGDDRWRWMRSRETVFKRDAEGRPRQMLGILEDVSEKVGTRESLEKALSELKLVAHAVENADESIVITDAEGIIQYVNPACERVTGYSKEESVGRHTRGLKSGKQDAAYYKELWDTIRSGRVWHGHFINKRKDGALFEEDASIAPVSDEAGRVTNFVAVKRDVTKERSLEAQLQQAQKLEAVGRLAGGIAHDFNNILTAILGHVQLANGILASDDPLKEDLSEIEKGALRAADLTRQLLIFSRKQRVNLRAVDPAEVLGALQKMLKRIVGEQYVLRSLLKTGGAKVQADPSQLEQLVLNFVVNSRDAMPSGGEIVLAARAEDFPEPLDGVDGPIPPGRYVHLSVADSGHGIPPSVLPRLFEPFFTTKPEGQGTGLGLATVYGIVKQGGAFLRVETEVGRGTTMSVYWPACAGEGRSEEPDPPRLPGGSEEILLVEDDAAIRRLAERNLSLAGYHVTSCASGEEALACLSERHRLVFTDLVMPGMGGARLAELAHGLSPRVKLLFTSGYSDQATPKGAAFLPKPYTQETLLRAVRDALDS